jgi:hypothetical protein
MDTEDGEKGLPLDQYRSRTWGLVPTQAVLGEFTLESLKKKYPDYSDDQLRLLRDTVLDEFGHYRSNLYQQAIGKKLQIGLDKQDYQMGKVLENANQEAKRAIDATKKGDGLSPNPDMKYDFNTGTRQGDRIVYTDGSFQYVGATGPNYKRYDSSGSSLGYGVPNTGYDFQDAVKGAGAVSNNLAPNTYNSKVNALPSTPFSSMLSTDKTLYNKAGGAVQPGDLPAGWTVDENSRITKL